MVQSFNILVENQIIPIQRETLKIREDNNSFQNNFKAPHSNNPFLIIRNDFTSRLLKVDSIQTVGKKRTIDCQVQQDNIIYPGRLTILEPFKNTIKCDLTYYSTIFPILSNKIATYMPTVSVIGDTTPEPYIEESSTDIDDTPWEAFSLSNKYNSWPTNDFCLPWIEHKDRYGEDLEKGDEWFYYAGTINRYFASTGEIVRNDFADADFDNDQATPDTREFYNRNVVVPCVFLLSPIYHALQSVGYKMAGDFVEDPKVQKIIMIPKEDQLTVIKPMIAPVEYSYDGLSFLPYIQFRNSFNTVTTLENAVMRISHVITQIGPLTVDINIDASNTPFNQDQVFCVINIGEEPTAEYIQEFAHDDEGIISGSAIINPSPDNIGQNIHIYYVHRTSPAIAPIDSTITITQEEYDTSIYRFHPTIELSRYTPDVTVANYINDFLKNWHNLRIRIDDIKKIVYFDYNETFITSSSSPVILDNLKTNGFTTNKYDSFTISYAGEDGESIFINDTGVITNGVVTESTQELNLKVKPAPYNNTTSNITSDFLNESGTVVALFSATTGMLPYTADTVNGKTLSLAGSGGMYNTNFKVWYRFRINASSQTVIALYSSVKLEQIKLKGKVYFNNQLYIVSSIQQEERSHVKEVTIDLESVNF